MTDGDALAGTGLLKSDHYLHLRCELPAADMLGLLDPVADHPRVRMISLMDHSPGIGQYADMTRYRALRVKEGLDDAYIERRIVELQSQRARLRDPNRKALLARVPASVVLASHDDRTQEEIDENHRDGHPDQRVPRLDAGRDGRQGPRHAGDRRRAEHRPRRQP